eukprot:834852_1
MQPMTGTTDMTGTDTNTDGAQRQGFRKVLRLRLITIRIRMISAVKWQNLNQWKWRHHDHQRVNRSMRRKAPKNYDQCSVLQITCNGISNEIVPRIMRDIQTLNQDIQRYAQQDICG